MNNSFNNISSKYLYDHLKSTIIQLAKIIQIEKQCTIEESIEHVRKFLIITQNELIDKEILDNIKAKLNIIKISIKNRKATETDRWIYNTLKKIGIE